MTRLSIIMMAFALVISFTQCKKDKPTATDSPIVLEGETYNITLTLGGGNNSRSDVDPNDGQDIAPVKYEIGDVIWVAYNGAHCGTLECTLLSSSTDQNSDPLGVFTGTITLVQDGEKPLYFYHLGNKEATVASGNGGYTVDLSDQSAALPVISYAASKEIFPSSDNTYTVEYNWLMNQCALVKFKMENIYAMSANSNDNNPDAIYKTIKPITIYGIDNQVTVNLSSNEFTWSQTNNGAVTLYRDDATNDSVRYAIVHHNSYGITAGALDVEFNPSTDPYGFYGTYKIQGNIPMNDYFQDAKIDLVWHSGAYSINSSGGKVVFSRGNLQYKDRSTATWRFAKHQYDWVGGELEHQAGVFQGNVVYNENDATSSTLRSDNVKIGDVTYEGWIDLFGYGVTAHNPTYHEKGNSHYVINNGTLLNPDYRFDEWGENNIVNSGTPGNTSWWTTLTKDECVYVFEDRASADNKVGFAEITLNDGFGNAKVRGLVVLPDRWDDAWHPSTWKKADWEVISLLHDYDLDWPIYQYNNVYTTAQWRDMELHGAVFLPAAGYRDQDGSNNTPEFDDGHEGQQNRGTYWAKGAQGPDAAWGFAFGYASGNDWIINGNHVQGNCGMAPDNGRSVRLVHRLSSSKFLFNKN